MRTLSSYTAAGIRTGKNEFWPNGLLASWKRPVYVSCSCSCSCSCATCLASARGLAAVCPRVRNAAPSNPPLPTSISSTVPHPSFTVFRSRFGAHEVRLRCTPLAGDSVERLARDTACISVSEPAHAAARERAPLVSSSTGSLALPGTPRRGRLRAPRTTSPAPAPAPAGTGTGTGTGTSAPAPRRRRRPGDATAQQRRRSSSMRLAPSRPCSRTGAVTTVLSD